MSDVKIKNKLVIKQKTKPAPTQSIAPQPRAQTIGAVLWRQRDNPSRHTLVKKFTEALCEDFDAHGMEAIQACRVYSPDVYVRVIANLLPKDVHITTEKELSDSELELQLLRYLAADAAKVVAEREGGIPETIEGTAAESVEE